MHPELAYSVENSRLKESSAKFLDVPRYVDKGSGQGVEK